MGSQACVRGRACEAASPRAAEALTSRTHHPPLLLLTAYAHTARRFKQWKLSPTLVLGARPWGGRPPGDGCEVMKGGEEERRTWRCVHRPLWGHGTDCGGVSSSNLLLGGEAFFEARKLEGLPASSGTCSSPQARNPVPEL